MNFHELFMKFWWIKIEFMNFVFMNILIHECSWMFIFHELIIHENFISFQVDDQPDSQGLHLRYPRYGEDPDTGW